MASRLREWRRLRMMTQAEVAQAVGVSTNAYAAWERGEAAPRLRHLRRLAAVLKVAPAAMLAAFPNGTSQPANRDDVGKAAAA